MRAISENKILKKQEMFREIFADSFELPDGSLVKYLQRGHQQTKHLKESIELYKLSSLGTLSYLSTNSYVQEKNDLDENGIWGNDSLHRQNELIDIILVGKSYEWLMDFDNLKKLPQLRFFDSPEQFMKQYELRNVEEIETLNEFLNHHSLMKLFINHPNRRSLMFTLETAKRKCILPDLSQYFYLREMLGLTTMIKPILNFKHLNEENQKLFAQYEAAVFNKLN
jgi:hypothetical protein